MTLNITKVAYGCISLAELVDRIAARAAMEGEMRMTTRNCPKRFAEIAGQGSLFWIIRHQLIARSPILCFEQNPEGKWDILLEPRVIPSRAFPRRAHQGWRYLEGADAPPDLADGETTGDPLPPKLLGALADLSLI